MEEPVKRTARKYQDEPTWADRVFESPITWVIGYAILLSPFIRMAIQLFGG